MPRIRKKIWIKALRSDMMILKVVRPVDQNAEVLEHNIVNREK
ncbi:hypothetical protein [Fusibacter ferrireducens]|nr:hypothetical protein [Fusibacter ferrireducens]